MRQRRRVIAIRARGFEGMIRKNGNQFSEKDDVQKDIMGEPFHTALFSHLPLKGGAERALSHPSPHERSEWWGGSTRAISERRGGGYFRETAPHPGLSFASAFPPHRYAGGGIRPRRVEAQS